MLTAPAVPDERLYLHDDAELGVTALRDRRVRDRHIQRYVRCAWLAGRRGGRWLDIACGSGYGALILRAYGGAADVLAVDADPTAIAFARRHHARAGVTFTVGTAADLPDGAFDVAVSIETLEHLPQAEQPIFLAHLARACKPDGVLVLACPVGDGPSVTNPHHLYEPSRIELDRMLRRHWRDVRIGVDEYQSTSGPARQAWCLAAGPL